MGGEVQRVLIQDSTSSVPRGVVDPVERRWSMQDVVQQTRSAFKWLHVNSLQKLTTKRMRVAETVALGEKRTVTILQVDGTQMLIGSAAGSVALLAIFSESENEWRTAASALEKKA
jgi:hypothetical protein